MASQPDHLRRQQEIFDREFGKYQEYHLENWRVSYLRRMYERLQIAAGAPAGERFLDVGVGGSGYSVIEAARRGVPSVGIDLSEEGVRKARRFALESLDEEAPLCAFVVASAEALPFADGAFHRVASVAVLEHVPRDDWACAEMARVASPGGRVFVSVPNTYTRTPLPYRVLGRVNDRRVGHLRQYVAEELIERFEKRGMVKIDLTYHAHTIKILQWLLTLLLPAMRRPEARLWWRLERRDLRQWDDPRALAFSLTLVNVTCDSGENRRVRNSGRPCDETRGGGENGGR